MTSDNDETFHIIIVQTTVANMLTRGFLLKQVICSFEVGDESSPAAAEQRRRANC